MVGSNWAFVTDRQTEEHSQFYKTHAWVQKLKVQILQTCAIVHWYNFPLSRQIAPPPYLQQSLQENSIGPLSTAIYTHTHKQVVQINGAWILAFDLIYYSDSLVESKSWDWVMTNLYLSKFSGAQISHLRELDHFQWTKIFIFQSHWLPVPVAALACQNPRRLQQKRNQWGIRFPSFDKYHALLYSVARSVF